MLTSQHVCQFSMFVFLLCCSFCTPEGETNYPGWQTRDFEFTVDGFPTSTDRLVSLPLSDGGPRLVDRYKSSTSDSRVTLEDDLEDNSSGSSATSSSSSSSPSSSADRQGPLENFLSELFQNNIVALRGRQQPLEEEEENSPFSKSRQNLRMDWLKGPLSSSPVERRAGGSDPGLSGNLRQEGAISDAMLSSIMAENLPLMSKRIMVRKRVSDSRAPVKRWWGNYYRPRPQMDRRANQSKHYGCLKRCINAGKLHPIQCHTLC